MGVRLERVEAVDGGGGHTDPVDREELGNDRDLVRVRVRLRLRVRVRVRVRVRG
jgi:hypothetical protein